ncbi:putative arsenite transporter, ACR3 family [Prochlorococcus marinus str. NATL2A]|uniref:Arsenite transporter, ACR3 family n=1 Tax=Prochlorococcus marinus (strain NATL2A) TaxID=59920 RepID=Q46KN9_PROMT|nr:ACR3 family arsenite efflux transporter [Prochlorococcus marinus]AAZ57939.1 putative arsenite transporter, ACR3 family [Prochlorococcus marinus str. NATL2A]
MSLIDRYLSYFIAVSMILGVSIGSIFPNFSNYISSLELTGINLPIAFLIWGMIIPMMLSINFNSIIKIKDRPQAILITIIVNWLIKPILMTGIAILFINNIFSSWIDAAKASEYISGMILLGVAPCTAMVFVWSNLVKGNSNYTLVQVIINDLILLFAFAPIASFLLGVNQIKIPLWTIFNSVLIYVFIPLLFCLLIKKIVNDAAKIYTINNFLKPISGICLVLTVLFLFLVQASEVINNPFQILLIAIPLIIQTFLIFFITAILLRIFNQEKSIAGPASMIGASNFFELAVAIAISLFGVNSGAATATVVGVLVEVPVMLSLVGIVNNNDYLFPTRAKSFR